MDELKNSEELKKLSNTVSHVIIITAIIIIMLILSTVLYCRGCRTLELNIESNKEELISSD